MSHVTEKEDFIKSTFGNELQNIFNHEIFLLMVLVMVLVVVLVVLQQLDMYVPCHVYAKVNN